MTPRICVLIAAAGHPALLERTLQSLGACEKPSRFAGTLVVENGPRSGIEAVVSARPRDERVRYIYVPEPNKSHALNVCLQQLGDELIFFTDDDVRFDSRILLVYAQASWGVTEGEFYGGPLYPDYESGPPPDWYREFLPKTACGWEVNTGGVPRVTMDRTFLGPNWAAFAGDLRSIGGFEPRLGPGAPTGSTGQETEAQQRLIRAGVRGVYVSNARAWHFVRSRYLTRQWIVERGYRHGLEWGIRMARDPKFTARRERRVKRRMNRRIWFNRLLRLTRMERWTLTADYWDSRWRGRMDGITFGRRWDEIEVPEMPEFATLRRAA
jgi:glycosyltransferase involved in cell wall biosynthesis